MLGDRVTRAAHLQLSEQINAHYQHVRALTEHRASIKVETFSDSLLHYDKHLNCFLF